MKNSKMMTHLNLAVLYRIMMKRVAKNYSPAQLSFLIGKPDDYVNKVEMLQTTFYTDDDIRCIATALEDERLDSYYPLCIDETKVEVVMERAHVNNTIVYHCKIINAAGEKATYFTLTDETERYVLTPEGADLEFTLASAALLLLIKAEYFCESQLAVLVHTAVNFFLGRKMNPNSLHAALKDLGAAEVPLIHRVEIEGERFAYQQLYAKT